MDSQLHEAETESTLSHLPSLGFIPGWTELCEDPFAFHETAEGFQNRAEELNAYVPSPVVCDLQLRSSFDQMWVLYSTSCLRSGMVVYMARLPLEEQLDQWFKEGINLEMVSDE